MKSRGNGWGWGGMVGESGRKKGRSPYAKDLTEKDKQTFEETGKVCWVAMEKLRLQSTGDIVRYAVERKLV